MRVADIAKVEYGREIRVGAVTFTRKEQNPVNGKTEVNAMGEVVAGVVLKRMGANTKATIDDINTRAELIEQALPEGVSFEVFYDQADLVKQAVTTVVDALLMAFVFIVIILALFLVNLRATSLVLLSIPISIGIALMVMAYFGMSANLMSLGGLAVAIGMLVDGSVVMVENIFKHLTREQNQVNTKCSQTSLSITTQVVTAAKEVCSPIFFATAIIIVVFAPLFALEGVEGKLFQPMAVSIILAMLSALVVALLVVPAAAVYLFRRGVSLKQSPVLVPIEKAYKKLLSTTISKPLVVMSSALVMFTASMLLLPRLGTEFVPELEEGTINLRVTLAPTASLQTSLDIAPKIEAILMDFPEVEYALSRIGAPELGGDPEPVSNIEIYIGLKPVDEWQSANNRFELQHLMEDELSVFPGLLFTFSQPIATRVDELLSGVLKRSWRSKYLAQTLAILSAKGRAIDAIG